MNINKEENKKRFEELIRSIKREGANIEDLLKRLEKSDWYYAPASTKYHLNCEGGLCQHSLNVYDNLVKLVDLYKVDISEDSIKICALLHDLSKMNLYVKSAKNKKVYSPNGTKRDELGNFDWTAELSYTINEDRFIYGNHEETSEFMIRSFIPLTYIESSAILNHHSGMNFDSTQGNISSQVFEKYNLAVLLHLSDMISTFLIEKRND